MKRPRENLKGHKCIVPISIGSSAHEGTKFKAALKLINSTFAACTIVMCDSLHRHSLAINNLAIGNSIKHRGKSHPIYVFISSLQDRHGQCVKFSIKDEGVGISVGEKESVFDAFVESSKTRSCAGGTGLGLSVAKEIVQAHKGKIWFEDLQDGEIGARVSFLLAA